MLCVTMYVTAGPGHDGERDRRETEERDVTSRTALRHRPVEAQVLRPEAAARPEARREQVDRPPVDRHRAEALVVRPAAERARSARARRRVPRTSSRRRGKREVDVVRRHAQVALGPLDREQVARRRARRARRRTGRRSRARPRPRPTRPGAARCGGGVSSGEARRAHLLRRRASRRSRSTASMSSGVAGRIVPPKSTRLGRARPPGRAHMAWQPNASRNQRVDERVVGRRDGEHEARARRTRSACDREAGRAAPPARVAACPAKSQRADLRSSSTAAGEIGDALPPRVATMPSAGRAARSRRSSGSSGSAARWRA